MYRNRTIESIDIEKWNVLNRNNYNIKAEIAHTNKEQTTLPLSSNVTK